MNQKKLITIICILFIAAKCDAQHFLDGTWTGNYTKTFLSVQPKKVVVNLQVVNDSFVTGTSHLYYNNENNFEHYTIHGFYDAKDSSIFFSEDSTIAVHLGFADDNCLGDYIMTLKAFDTMLRFSGKWKDNSFKFLGCPTTGVWLQKPLPKKPVIKKKDQNLERIADVQKLIELDTDETDSIKIELRDNAQIDGDVVSVYLNDEIVVSKQKLTSTPIVFYISIPNGTTICNVKMAAESMGSIPPCTALMDIATQKERYEVNLSSSMSNNSVVQFFVKE